MASNIIWITIFLGNKLRTQVRFDTVGEKNGVAESFKDREWILAVVAVINDRT